MVEEHNVLSHDRIHGSHAWYALTPLPRGQNGRHFSDDMFNRIFLN